MFLSTGSMGLRLTLHVPARHATTSSTTSSILSSQTRRSISYSLIARGAGVRTARQPPTSTNAPSSFFTPSLCRAPRRHASTTASTPRNASGPSTLQAQVLDWNTFFRLRTSRRRYGLASSLVMSFVSTGAMFVFLSTQPELADQITKLVPTDPFISMGVATFGATLLGWLIGPIFGNAVWRLFHRARLLEFTTKERAFFERIKKHRVNPTGASTNNPVPDYYGEKIGSVSGYRRWLKDQRAFNKKREGSYSATI